MGKEAFTPGTTKQRLSLPLNGTIYTTTRPVASEKPFPEVGGTMEAELGSAFATSYIIAVSDSPSKSGQLLAITHASIPSEAEQLLSNWEHTTCDIGGQKFDAVSRTVIMLASNYSETTPATGSAMPDGTPFSASAFLLENRQTVRSGIELEPVFRVEKRSYVKRVVIRDVVPDDESGKAYTEKSTLYFRGEVVSGSDKIEDLDAAPTNAYWGLQAGGVSRSCKQLSEDWFEVLERQAETLLTETSKKVSRLRPQKFFAPDSVVTTEATTIVTEGATISTPAPTLGQEIEVSQKGRKRKDLTTTQQGSPVALNGLDYMPDDGRLYPRKTELIAASDVPTTPSVISADGTIVTYQAGDAENAEKETRQAESPDTSYRLETSRLIPDAFFEDGKLAVSEESTFGDTSAPDFPTPTDQMEIVVTQKGAVRKTKMTLQEGVPSDMKGTFIDQRTGEAFVETTEVVLKSAVTATPIDDEGNLVVYEPINARWSRKITRKEISTLSKTWVEAMSYEWPAVLKEVIYKIWTRKFGEGDVIFAIPIYKKGFSGPQLCTITQYWQKDAPTVTAPAQMIPEGFDFQSPLFGLRVDPCLHGEITMTCTIGTEDPEWESDTFSQVFPATNYTEWPTEIQWTEAKPYKGGYLVTETVLPKPA